MTDSLTGGLCPSTDQQWYRQHSISWSHRTSCSRVCRSLITIMCMHTCISYFRATQSPNQSRQSLEEDYQFVEQPPKDLLCPVTFGLLLQPHLTSCCGNHMSQEAASRIQREGGACPLCNTHPWNTMFSKHFQRQVKSLHVFCCHDHRGCGWQGELANFDSHVQSCPMRDAPPMTELMKLPL